MTGPADTIDLVCGPSHARIAYKGAELRALELNGRPIIWTGDPAWWGHTSPILFPIVGRVRDGTILVDGQRYRLDMHGFAREAVFELVAHEPASIRLRLSDTPATRQGYPFAFRLEVVFELTESALAIRFEVTADQGPLPYALGYHPAFFWPTEPARRGGHRVDFQTQEAPRVETFANGLLTGSQRAIPDLGRSIWLADELFASGSALCFLNARSSWLDLVDDSGQVMRLSTTNFPHLAIWSKPGAPFISLEAWTGHGDIDGFDGEFASKPSMLFAQPGHTNHHLITLSLHPEGDAGAEQGPRE